MTSVKHPCSHFPTQTSGKYGLDQHEMDLKCDAMWLKNLCLYEILNRGTNLLIFMFLPRTRRFESVSRSVFRVNQSSTHIWSIWAIHATSSRRPRWSHTDLWDYCHVSTVDRKDWSRTTRTLNMRPRATWKRSVLVYRSTPPWAIAVFNRKRRY